MDKSAGRRGRHKGEQPACSHDPKLAQWRQPAQMLNQCFPAAKPGEAFCPPGKWTSIAGPLLVTALFADTQMNTLIRTSCGYLCAQSACCCFFFFFLSFFFVVSLVMVVAVLPVRLLSSASSRRVSEIVEPR